MKCSLYPIGNWLLSLLSMPVLIIMRKELQSFKQIIAVLYYRCTEVSSCHPFRDTQFRNRLKFRVTEKQRELEKEIDLILASSEAYWIFFFNQNTLWWKDSETWSESKSDCIDPTMSCIVPKKTLGMHQSSFPLIISSFFHMNPENYNKKDNAIPTQQQTHASFVIP